MVHFMSRIFYVIDFSHVASFDAPMRARLTPGTLAFLQSAR
jgi:hypothetical protein